MSCIVKLNDVFLALKDQMGMFWAILLKSITGQIKELHHIDAKHLKKKKKSHNAVLLTLPSIIN